MPFIIFGTKGVTSTSDSGRFHCPQCRTERTYEHKNVRRFFTLFFVPLIPLDTLGEYVECQLCRTNYNTSVLAYNPGKQKRYEAELNIAIKRVLVKMALADGVVDDEDIDKVHSIYSQITNSELTIDEINDEIILSKADGRRVEQFLSGMAGNLNASGKKLVLEAAILIAGADGEFQDEEITLIESIGKALDLPASQISHLIQKIKSENSAQ